MPAIVAELLRAVWEASRGILGKWCAEDAALVEVGDAFAGWTAPCSIGIFGKRASNYVVLQREVEPRAFIWLPNHRQLRSSEPCWTENCLQGCGR
jgi:hypothetical protein